MDLMDAKLIAIFVLATSSILVGLLPAWFWRYGRNQYPLLLSGLLCFGGGVLLSTSVVHILPEVRENLPEYKAYAEVLFACGFFVLYVLDELVHLVFRNSGHGHSHDELSETQPLLHEQLPYNPNFVRYSEDYGALPTLQLCHIGHEEPRRSDPVGSIGLLIALSVHAVLEGLAVGLETSTTQVLLLFGAIASHKLVVGFCLGMELAAENTALKHFFAILVFSMGSPLGIGLGMIFNHIPKTIMTYLQPILQGLAGGTLFYVSVSEVLPRERARWHTSNTRKYAGLFQFACVAVGFTVMTALNMFLDC